MGGTGSCQANPDPKNTKSGGLPVRLAVTSLTNSWGDSIPAAYHTSVSIGDMEYSFGPSGVSPSKNWLSHQMIRPGQEPEVVLYLGSTCVAGSELLQVLSPHFKAGTYDLLLKNCNSFSNAALFYLLGIQLDAKYTALDRAGVAVDKLGGLVQLFSLGFYNPNPKASDFQLDKVLHGLNEPEVSAKSWIAMAGVS
eukprot:TRINITY_DN112346_c0_g1_i1.p1 TRINITY_DN112346_c0_g1~~TRINITY_DN112346_c0_g1_i1.p1  ORF type:complete len:224 (-),score=39.27 TRINITY_DN112346_c0_g1_i1:37-621(-)